MADPCVIKSGEVVTVDDPRLADTGCIVEVGAIIRPPTDLSVAVPQKPKPAMKRNPVTTIPVAPVVADSTVAEIVKVEEQKAVQTVRKKETTQASTVQPEPVKETEDLRIDTPEVIAVAVVGTIAVAGAAAATSASGGISALQAKIASLLGASKTTVATTAVVTAGTIVAVKALENKMSNLEASLNKTKKDVDETSAAADRIDELLNRLGG